MSETKAPGNGRGKLQYAGPEEELAFLRRRVAELETQSQQFYQQNYLLQQRLAASNLSERERAEFISHVAHELRTPLTSIKGYIDLVLEGETGPITDLQRDFLSVAGLNAEKLSRIIGDLLDVSRLEAGQLGFKPTLVDLPVVCAETCMQIRPQLEARGVHLEIEIEPSEQPTIASLDPERFSQALRAIVAHAGQVTPQDQGKTVRFSLQRSADGHYAEIRVDDEGPGIDLVDIDRVFTKFWRPQNQSWREGGGAGLGLAIAKAIVDVHEGKIRAENRPAEVGGSAIIIEMPLVVQPINIRSLPSREIPDTPRYAALVISRNPDFGRVMQQTLGPGGFQVIVASDRSELVSETPAWQPDLVINNGAEPDLLNEEDSDQIAPALKGANILTVNLSPLEQRVIAAGARAVLPWPGAETLLLDAMDQTMIPDEPEIDVAAYKQQQTILLVSSSSEALRGLDKLVREAGYSKLYRAMREADALTLARRYRPSWLLLDLAEENLGNAANDEPNLFELLREEDQFLSRTPTVIFLRPDQIAPDPAPDYRPSFAGVGRARRGMTGELGLRRGATGELELRRGTTGSLGRRRGTTGKLSRRNATGELAGLNSEENKGLFYNIVPKPFMQRRLLTVARRLAGLR